MKTLLVLLLSSLVFAPMANAENQFPDEARREVEFALDWILGLEFSETTELHKEFFGELNTGAVYAEYLSRIESFVYREVRNNSTAATVSRSRPVINITQNFVIRDDYGWVDKASILIHEVRHIAAGEGRFGHIKCPEYDMEGEILIGHVSGIRLRDERACDGHHRGAYGHQTVMLANIANYCTNCSEEEKERARFFADRMIRRIVRNPGAYRRLKEDTGL